jgi:hypothetical protein
MTAIFYLGSFGTGGSWCRTRFLQNLLMFVQLVNLNVFRTSMLFLLALFTLQWYFYDLKWTCLSVFASEDSPPGEWLKNIVHCTSCLSVAAAVGLRWVSVTYHYIRVHKSEVKQLSIELHNVLLSTNIYWRQVALRATSVAYILLTLVSQVCQGHVVVA